MMTLSFLCFFCRKCLLLRSIVTCVTLWTAVQFIRVLERKKLCMYERESQLDLQTLPDWLLISYFDMPMWAITLPFLKPQLQSLPERVCVMCRLLRVWCLPDERQFACVSVWLYHFFMLKLFVALCGATKGRRIMLTAVLELWNEVKFGT